MNQKTIWTVCLFLTATSLGLSAVSYTALSDAAKRSGQLNLYQNAPVTEKTMSQEGHTISFSVPKSARAYDVIPIPYSLKRPVETGRTTAVQAVAFEDIAKSGNQSLYDLAIPGNMRVQIDYLGSISADTVSDNYVPLTADGQSPPSPFPPFRRDPMVCSSDIRAAHLIWFKFKITNTGDTILDPEGVGASFAQPVLVKLDENNKVVWTADNVNRFVRHLDYLYPGQSCEVWCNFETPNPELMWRWGLHEGRYQIDFRMVARLYDRFDWLANIWSGKEFARLSVPFTVSAAGSQQTVKPVFEQSDIDTFPAIFDRFEEFMTTYQIHPSEVQFEPISETLYLQVAPWTTHVVVKMILTNPERIIVEKIPIRITDETLKISYNPDNIMVINKHGKETPAVMAQPMPGMRTGVIHHPFPEQYMRDNLQEMKDLGINLIVNTSGDWHIHEIAGRKEIFWHAASYKHFYDVLMRQMDMTAMGWSIFPPSATHWYDIAEYLLGRKLAYHTTGAGYGGRSETVDMADPAVPEVIAAWAKYNYKRWGDLWFKTKDGRIPVDLEETWGWMRDDINCRYRIGAMAIARFRKWVENKYQTIENVNLMWGSNYRSFEEIDPEADQGVEGDGIGTAAPVYNKKDHVFHEWNAALEDFDTFRTELRMEILKKTNALLKEFLPGAEIQLRCEGANPLIKGNPNSDNMHWRYIYYSQRRNAMILDVLRRENVLHFYSDYTTLPYSEQEWRIAMREMTQNGFIPNYLPQFDHMRDIVLNSCYGREYQLHYNLDKPSKGMMVHCLQAAFPIWKITYEEGGAPGILWEDYMCDGFATATQKKELQLLRRQFESISRK